MAEFTVRTKSAELLDQTVRGLPGARAHVMDGTWDSEKETCRVKVEGDAGFFRFAMTNQGYGDIVAEHSETERPMPEAWVHLIEGLTLLAKGQTSDISPLWCEHDALNVCADPERFTPEEITRLNAWGFDINEDRDGFRSMRFGSA